MEAFLKTVSPLLKKGDTIVMYCTMELAGLVVVVNMVIVAAFPYSVDYGERPLLDQAMRIREGEPIYKTSITDTPYTITNYPPVFTGILSLFNSRESSSLLAGRILSALSTLGSAFLIFQIIYFSRQDKLAGLTAAVIFLIFPFVFQWGGYMRVDNLALFFAIAALYTLLRWQEGRLTTARLAPRVTGETVIVTGQGYCVRCEQDAVMEDSEGRLSLRLIKGKVYTIERIGKWMDP